MRTPINRGFSFIEMTLYSALLSGILALVILSIYPLFRSIEVNSTSIVEDMEALFIFRKIAHMTTDLQEVIIPIPYATSTSLQLRTFSGKTHILTHVDYELLLGSEGEDLLPLNTSRAPVTDFMVMHQPENASSSALLKITFMLSDTTYGPILIPIP